MEKDEAHRLVDRMPPNATWDDLMGEIYVREAVEHGLAESKAGLTKDVNEDRALLSLHYLAKNTQRHQTGGAP